MTQEFQFLMRLSAHAARGTVLKSDGSDLLRWEQVFRLAKQQGVDVLASYGLKISDTLPCPDAVRQRQIANMRRVAAADYMRRCNIMRLLAQMEEAGIHAVLLKGYAIAGCYRADGCRASIDTDIWVDPADEKRACAFLAEQGFRIEPRWENGHHAVCYHPEMGCVELHVILYDEIVEEIWFGKMDGHEFVAEPHLRVESKDGSYITLGHTDHLIFLTLHMIKHFIMNGMSLRMMLDTAMFYIAHRDEIDFNRYWTIINGLQYGVLLNSILWGLIDYCGFQTGDFPGISAVRPDAVEMILDDLEIGGTMGCNDKAAREEGWYEFNRQKMMREKTAAQYQRYMQRWKIDMHLRRLFPQRKELENNYPVIQKYPVLIPFVWIHRLFTKGIRYITQGHWNRMIVTEKTELSDAAKQRLAMFHKLNML